MCGDGMVSEPYEVCDSNNNDNCGACRDDCRTVSSAQAIGYIFAAPGIEYQKINGKFAGDYFVLLDGSGNSLTFDFSEDSGGTNIHIVPHDNDDNAAMAGAIATQINNARDNSHLLISATPNGGVVTLTHQRASVKGNQPIRFSVSSSNFAVVDMHGGLGGDCPAGTGCHDINDCQPPLVCADSDHKCAVNQ